VGIGQGTLEDLGLDSSFWRGRKVFLTGHTGFKGSWLSLWLQSLGADVLGYSVGIPTKPSLFELARVDEGLLSIEGDVRDRKSLLRALDQHRPEIVVHLAAQALVRRSYRAPLETYETNVVGTANILEAARRVDGIRVVIVVTSDKCYEPRSSARPYREDDPKGGDDPYSSSKAAAELVTAAYRVSFFSSQSSVSVASVRAGNVIGGGDWAEDRLVADTMASALADRPVLIRNPDAVRPWQHVLNPLEGYLLLAERLWNDPSLANAWNFGPDESDARPVRWIVERLSELWPRGIEWRRDEGSHPRETHALVLDSSRARELLCWVPRWDLERALAGVVEWFRAYEAGDDLHAVSLDQIRAYESTSPSVPLRA
jgi:CDP-glucose 4,6-dehydratase